MPSERPRRSGGEVFSAIVLTALGRKEGLRRFVASKEGFLASLAPLIAFPLVGSALLAAGGEARLAGMQFLATLCALLAPPVAAYELARLWKREEAWLLFATAFNWCQWTIPLVAAVAVAILVPPLTRVLGGRGAVEAALGVAGLYALWLHWFIARHTLGISALRAVLLVIVINIASAVAGIGPALLAQRA
jgi:hypothetical protein